MKTGINALDCRDTYLTLDPTGLRHRLRRLPSQCREAWANSNAVDFPGHWRSINKVVIGGMGGSAIAGDLVNDLATHQQSVPITLVRDFCLPFKLDNDTLFIGCSYSGSTEETLSLFRQAVNRHTPALAIAGGGTLAGEAQASGVPVLRINSPGEARSAVGYNLMLLLGALNKAGIMVTRDDDVQAAISALEGQISRCNEDIPTADNPAKLLAQELVNRLVLMYGGGLFAAMARRWKSQLNENAKAWAFFEVLPELLHNSVEAFQPAFTDGENMTVLLLQPSSVGTELTVRFEAVVALLHRGNISHQVLKTPQYTPLGQMLSMLALGDYVSYYLALLKGLDPSPTPNLQMGKELLTGPSE